MIGSIKRIVLRIFHVLGCWRILSWGMDKFPGKRKLVVFTFHRITDAEKDRHYYLNYDRGQDKIEFANQIEAISRFFEVVNLETFIDIVVGKRKPRTHTALLTFDDADSEFLTQALPALKRYNYPSVVYTPTDFVDTDRRFWHLRVSNAIENINEELWDKIKLDSTGLPESIGSIIRDADISSTEAKTATCQLLVNSLNHLEQTQIDKILDRMEEITGKRYTLGIECLSWDDHRKLSKQGVKFDSHTAYHRKLGELEPEEIRLELTESKLELEKQLGIEVLSICYPAGSYSRAVVEIAPQCGYTVGFTTKPGICKYPIEGGALFELPRFIIYGREAFEIEAFFARHIFGNFD